jgi:hypothetical protein
VSEGSRLRAGCQLMQRPTSAARFLGLVGSLFQVICICLLVIFGRFQGANRSAFKRSLSFQAILKKAGILVRSLRTSNLPRLTHSVKKTEPTKKNSMNNT